MVVLPVGVLLMLPPTDLKASWTSVRYVPPPLSTRPIDAGAPAFADQPAPPPVRADPPDEGFESWQKENAVSREEARVADADADYGRGYGWASDRGITHAGACRRLRGARAEGCRDYVASLAEDGGTWAADDPETDETAATAR